MKGSTAKSYMYKQSAYIEERDICIHTCIEIDIQDLLTMMMIITQYGGDDDDDDDDDE